MASFRAKETEKPIWIGPISLKKGEKEREKKQGQRGKKNLYRKVIIFIGVENCGEK